MYSNEKIQKFLAVLILVLVPIFVFKEYRSYNLRKKQENTFVESMVQNEYGKKTAKSFVFIIFSKEGFPLEQLESIFSQNYSSYRVVYLYVDDQDLSYKQALSWAEERNIHDKLCFVKRLDEEEELSCFYSILHACLDDEIVVQLSKGELLMGKDVLTKLNEAYLDPDVWLTYVEASRSGKKLERSTKNIKQMNPSKNPWIQSSIRTYYVGLLKQTAPSLEKLKEIYCSKEDKTLMTSLLELGKWHVKEISDSLTKQPSN